MLTLGLALFGCGGDDKTDDSAGGGGGGGPCVDDTTYFQQSVSLPILEKDCMTCHNAQGLARGSKLVLLSPAETDAYRINFERLKDVAAYERGGVSLLLLKPTAQVEHGGGERFTPDDDRYAVFEELLRRFADPVTCDGAEPEGELLDRVELAGLAETLRKAKIQLIGELPTPAEYDAVASGGEAALEDLLADYMTQDAFYDVLKRWYNDVLHTDKYLRGDEATGLLDSTAYPNRQYYRELPEDTDEGRLARQHANRSVAREPLDLIAHVVRNDRPFTEILTADYTVVNPFSAPVFGVSARFDDATDPNELREARVEGVPHAGVLTSPMFLNRFPTTDTNRNRHRARMVWELFLGTDILQKAERPVDPTTIRDHNPTMNNPQCTVCHAAIDPMAGAFQNWDARGHYRPPTEGWFADMRPPGYGERAIPPDEWGNSLQWLAGELIRDERFALGAVQTFYAGLIGRKPLPTPTDDTAPDFAARLAFFNLEQAFLRRVTDHFVASGHDAKAIIPAIIASPFYRAVSAPGIDDASRQTILPLGTARLLTPEELDQQLEAVLGVPWRRRPSERRQLTSSSEFLFFYGGIDSDNVTSRITVPNGIMANIGLRMANEMACLVTAQDFRLPPDARRLFPHVESSFTPEDPNGFAIPQSVESIRRNIRHLHHRLLGEVLTPGDEEEEATFQLFVQTWREGYQLIQNEQISRDLNGLCRATRDLTTDEEYPEAERLTRDPNYTLRAWQAVVSALLADWRFLHHH